MADALKPDFVFRRNERVHLNRRGRQFSRLLAGELCTSACRSLYCSCKPVICSHVTLTGYPLHSLVSSSLLLPCVTVCHHISTGLYRIQFSSTNLLSFHGTFHSHLNGVQINELSGFNGILICFLLFSCYLLQIMQKQGSLTKWDYSPGIYFRTWFRILN
jgi:hypothetical protein